MKNGVFILLCRLGKLSWVTFKMNSHVLKYYRKSKGADPEARHFHEVIPLHEEKGMSWDEAHQKVSTLPRGWYELCHLSSQDRIELVRDFWLSTLPFIPHVDRFFHEFFQSLDDIGVYIVQWGEGLSYECEMVYSLRDGSCFYQGMPPSDEREILLLNDQFGGGLPKDFLHFLQIHSGFSKHSDTGMFRAEDMPRIHRKFVEHAIEQNLLIKSRDHVINPSDLIPFYESFGLRAYQCFFKEWYPEMEMGNVYFSFRDKTISDFQDPNALSDTLAFSSFLDWLIFYLETIGA